MQIIETKIDHARAEGGELLQQVRFVGEGGEKITVELREPAATNADGPIARAIAVLAQVVAFHAPAPLPEARFERIGTPQMFTFEYRDGGEIKQAPQAELPGNDAAQAEAMRSAIDLLDDLSPEELVSAQWLVRCLDAEGRVIGEVTAAEAVANRNRALETSGSLVASEAIVGRAT